jgi:hypothetical protein
VRLIKCVGIIISVTIGVISLWQLYFRMNLPYENGRYFDEINDIVYKSQSMIIFPFLLILCISSAILIILSYNKNR